ncbi:putative membrane protein YdjX (TVP38/TMEM64 family) [Salirhabdus euzebyi]|uniref:TVP38/TMEM64 family membrane protein n=1 Tax=Salirhabdus euzebyi TaxID=394506 RepID=A0A841Q5K7_9BACI|nr:TVP38/TMEM64 family protein [Salirhabdus euzebyi]MBB6453681.1 putative membrane protein YdjX (TVP38/TMEM64 family) [Salirhabdus euzebyi]
MKKLLTIGSYGILIVLLIGNKEAFLSLIRSGEEFSMVISGMFFALLVFFPIVPFVVPAGITGASFGILTGSMIIVVGVMVGTILMFLMARYGFQDFAQKVLSKYEKARQYEEFFERNAFITILSLRVFPVIPTPIVNILCGVSKVKLYTYTIGSLLGKLPRIIIFTVAGYQATENMFSTTVIYIVYFLVMAIVVGHTLKQQNRHVQV